MTLERFLPTPIKPRCGNCGTLIEGTIRYLNEKKKKPLCRDCFGKRLGRKKEDEPED